MAIMQRFGGALNTNIHFHALVLDGAFAEEGDGLRFHRGPAFDAADVADVLATMEAYLRSLLGGEVERSGDTMDPWADEAPGLAGLAAVIQQMLRHLGLPIEIPRRARHGFFRSRSEGAAPGRRGRPRLRVRRPRLTASARRPDRSGCACGSAVRLDLPPAGPPSPLTLRPAGDNLP